MSRSLLTWIPLGLLVVAAGCRMCAHPYDYWGPVLTGGCPAEGGGDARAGSILSGIGQPIAEGQPAPEVIMTPEPQPAPDTDTTAGPMVAPPSNVPNIDFGVDPKMIISVTDRKLGESDQSSQQPTQASPQGSLNWKAPKPADAEPEASGQ